MLFPEELFLLAFPDLLSPTSHPIKPELISYLPPLPPWQVDRQSQFIQGYRVLYRQMSGVSVPGIWQSQDVKVPSERSVLLSSLKKGIMYEFKVRPFFNEFQGTDSESRSARTSEEGKGTPGRHTS